MKRILFIAFGFKGEINQRIPVVQALQAMGHNVQWLSPIALPDEQLPSMGIEVFTLPAASPQGRLGALTGEMRARIVEDEAQALEANRDLYVTGVPRQVELFRERLRALRPDLVVLDGTIYAGVIACQLEQVPFANVSAGWMLCQPATLDYPMMNRVRTLAGDRAALFAGYGLAPEFRAWEVVSPLLNVVFTTDAMVGPTPEPTSIVQRVGPSLPVGQRGDEVSFAWERLDGRPLVFASFGSRVYWQPELFRKVAEAASPLGVQLLFSAGDLAEADEMRGLPGDPLLVPYVPQLAILARTAVFVTHAGANSVSEAMSCGVPLLAIPICNEEPVQAHFVERARVGICVEPRVATIPAIRDALRSLLDPDAGYRARAEAIQTSYRSTTGARTAAELIVAACG